MGDFPDDGGDHAGGGLVSPSRTAVVAIFPDFSEEMAEGDMDTMLVASLETGWSALQNNDCPSPANKCPAHVEWIKLSQWACPGKCGGVRRGDLCILGYAVSLAGTRGD